MNALSCFYWKCILCLTNKLQCLKSFSLSASQLTSGAYYLQSTSEETSSCCQICHLFTDYDSFLSYDLSSVICVFRTRIFDDPLVYDKSLCQHAHLRDNVLPQSNEFHTLCPVSQLIFCFTYVDLLVIHLPFANIRLYNFWLVLFII